MELGLAVGLGIGLTDPLPPLDLRTADASAR